MASGGDLQPILAAALAGSGLREGAFLPQLFGPPAVLAPAQLAQLGIWCAQWVERSVAPSARAELSAALDEARRCVEEPEAATARPNPPGTARYPTDHLSIARLAAAAARRAVNNPAATHVALCAAVKLVVRLERVAARRDRLQAETRLLHFLSALDDELFRLEAAAAVADRAEVDAVLWRHAQGAHVVSWLVRLRGPKSQRYGLLTTSGGRWHWTFGSRDDVLSNVPDTLFAEAVSSALSREVTLGRARAR